MSMIWSAIAIYTVTWIIFRIARASRAAKLDIPYLQFDGDNSPARYAAETEFLLARGYREFISKGLPFSIRDANQPSQPMIVLPLKYLDEIKWLPEQRMSFWKFIDKLSILKEIGEPGLTEENSLAARRGLNTALVHLIPDLQSACSASFTHSFPLCSSWTQIHPYPLIVKIFASMSAHVMVGPELGGIGSDWQRISMGYMSEALLGPREVVATYPRWLFWAARWTDPHVRRMRELRGEGAKVLAGALRERVRASKEADGRGDNMGDVGVKRDVDEDGMWEGTAQGKKGKVREGRRRYEDGVQWLYDAHRANGKDLTPEQLTRDLFVIMVASLHSTSAVGLSILFDMLDHPDVVDEIREEITRVKSADETWTRPKLAELRLLDSFMRESSRMQSLTQYTAIQRITTAPFTFKDGLTIPANTTLVFPGYHHNRDPSVHPDPDTFEARRHLRKREANEEDKHRYHFASAGSDDMINWGVGRHACPGRFFAQETLKLMFIHLLTEYEVKWVDGTEDTPKFVPTNLFLSPNPGLPVMVREKKAGGSSS